MDRCPTGERGRLVYRRRTCLGKKTTGNFRVRQNTTARNKSARDETSDWRKKQLAENVVSNTKEVGRNNA